MKPVTGMVVWHRAKRLDVGTRVLVEVWHDLDIGVLEEILERHADSSVTARCRIDNSGSGIPDRVFVDRFTYDDIVTWGDAIR